MTERFSLDANILVYAYDTVDGARRERALAILDVAVRRSCVLAVQALGEFHAAATRKGMLTRQEAIAQARDWSASYEIVGADSTALRAALALAWGGRLSLWDALLLATVEQAGCTLLLSEDMGDGARYGAVTVVNPFRGRDIPRRAAAALGLR